MAHDPRTSSALPAPSTDAWLRYLADRMPAMLWSVDRELRFLSGYGNGMTALGIRPGDLIGVSLFEYFETDNERFPAIAAVRKALAGERVTFEQRWLGNTYESVVEPLRDGGGQIVGCVGISFDITERKSAEANLLGDHAKWQRYLEHVPAVLYETAGKPDGSTMHVPFLSPRAVEFFGVSASEVFRNPLLLIEAIHPDDRMVYFEAAIASMQACALFDCEFRLLPKEGEERWVRAISQPTMTGDELHYFGVLVDITARKKRDDEGSRKLSEFLQNHIRGATKVNERLQREMGDRRDVEIALRKQTQLMDGIVSTMPVVAFRLSGRAELEDVHGAGLQRFGCADDFIAAFEATLSTSQVQAQVAEALRGGHVRFTAVGQQAEQSWAFDTFLTFDLSRGQGAIGFAMDVTEQHAATRELQAAEKTLRSEERLLRELLNLHERDRRLLALDIHDGFVQDVVGAHLSLEGMASQLEMGQDVDVEQFQKLRGLLRKAIDEGRRLISDLRPMIIDERGIIDAINYLIGEHQRFGGPEILFHHEVRFQRLPPLLEGTMFRIVQEALNNVHRHSQASEARIVLVQNHNIVRLTVQDDGIGFDLESVPSDRFGVRGMKERARLFGGKTLIQTAPGAGTEIQVELPLEMHIQDGPR